MIAIDSSVIIDLLANETGTSDGAEASLRQALAIGPVVVCDVVLAEITTALRDGAAALVVLEEIGIAYLATESASAVRAGEMQRHYRQRGGRHQRTVDSTAASTVDYPQCQGKPARSPRGAAPARLSHGECIRTAASLLTGTTPLPDRIGLLMTSETRSYA